MTTLKELAARATKGPRIHLSGDEIIWTQLNDGCRGLPVARIFGPDSENHANAQLIARCSPEVLLALYSELETALCRANLAAAGMAQQDVIAAIPGNIKLCLRLLDGQSRTEGQTK